MSRGGERIKLLNLLLNLFLGLLLKAQWALTQHKQVLCYLKVSEDQAED